jgi:CBS domain-containing protein
MGGRQARRPGIAGPHLQSVTIDDIIQTDVVTVEPDTPLQSVAAKLAEEDVGAVVAVEDDEPVGVVTDRQIALYLQEMTDPTEHTARDVLSEDIITGTTVLTVFEVLEQLSEEDIRRLPIVDDEGKLEGIVTLDDLLVLLGSELGKAADIIKTQSPRL